MKLVKLQLLTKNNKQNGFYLYSPIVEIGSMYHWCETIKSDRTLKTSDVDPKELIVKREIPRDFYKANGLEWINAENRT